MVSRIAGRAVKEAHLQIPPTKQLTPQQSATTLHSFQTDLGTSLLNKGDHQRVASHLGETEMRQKRNWKEKEEEDKNKKQNSESKNLRETKADY